jgi:hypothetical protein
MQPISLRGYQTLVGRSGGRETRASNARRDDDGSVGFARMDRAPRVARVYGALWILVLDFSQRERLGAAGVFLFLFNETHARD